MDQRRYGVPEGQRRRVERGTPRRYASSLTAAQPAWTVMLEATADNDGGAGRGPGEPDFTGGSHRNQPYRRASDNMAKRMWPERSTRHEQGQ